MKNQWNSYQMVSWAEGGQFFGTGMQAGGLVGGFAGGGVHGFRQHGIRQAGRMMAWQGGGMIVGGTAGYAYGGDAQSVLVGMNLGQFAGGVSRGFYHYGRSFGVMVNSCV